MLLLLFYAGICNCIPSYAYTKRTLTKHTHCPGALHSDECCQQVHSAPFLDRFFVPINSIPFLKAHMLSDSSLGPDPSRQRPVQSANTVCRSTVASDFTRYGLFSGAYICELECMDYRSIFYIERSPWPIEIRETSRDPASRDMLRWTKNHRRTGTKKMFSIVCPNGWFVTTTQVRSLWQGDPSPMRTVGYCYPGSKLGLPYEPYQINDLTSYYEPVPEQMLRLVDLTVDMNAKGSATSSCMDMPDLLLSDVLDFDTPATLTWDLEDSRLTGIGHGWGE